MTGWAAVRREAPGAAAQAGTRFLGVIRELQAAVSAVADCRTPVVAAVSMWCTGGGVDLTGKDIDAVRAERIGLAGDGRPAPPGQRIATDRHRRR